MDQYERGGKFTLVNMCNEFNGKRKLRTRQYQLRLRHGYVCITQRQNLSQQAFGVTQASLARVRYRFEHLSINLLVFLSYQQLQSSDNRIHRHAAKIKVLA